MTEDDALAEHLPQQTAPQMRQRGVDEQILFAERLRERAARPGLFLSDPGVAFHVFGYERQPLHGFELLRFGLFDIPADRAHYNLACFLRVAEVAPVQRRTVVRITVSRPVRFEQLRELQPGAFAVRTGDKKIGEPVIFRLRVQEKPLNQLIKRLLAFTKVY